MRLRTVVTVFCIMVLPVFLLAQDSTGAVPNASGSGLCGFLDPYQMPLVQAISAVLLWLMSRFIPSFADANDWLKRAAAFIAGTAVAFLLGRLGCTANADLTAGGSALLSGGVAMLINWLMFRLVKTQRSTDPV